ncbi:unnamed protein product [Cladocopium goreaui]|uniref:RRM domain-containing protein n=1 Tax=Cladocopium goreaui TaxID=2562237 RepID=A0A9P1M085_9DINO|nr:unnamed protein product [Cladocopium goreaui]
MPAQQLKAELQEALSLLGAAKQQGTSASDNCTTAIYCMSVDSRTISYVLEVYNSTSSLLQPSWLESLGHAEERTQLKPKKLPHLARLISGQGSSMRSFSVRLGPVALAAVSCRSLRAKATAVATARVRESGMPVVDWWEQLVSAESTLDLLGFVGQHQHETIVEFGCGYGTFTIPVAERVHQLYSFDIDHEMVGNTQQRLLSQKPHLENVKLEVRDVVATGYGLDTSVDAVLLMNILHCEAPVQMLQQAADLLKPGGLIYATHWRYCTEEFRPLSFQKAIELCRKHPRSMILFLVAFSALLLLPQLVYSTGALQEVIKNLDFAQQPDDVEEEGQADAAIEQSMLNARKIKHLGRVVSSHIVDLNKRMRKFEKLTGITAGEAYPNESPPNGYGRFCHHPDRLPESQSDSFTKPTAISCSGADTASKYSSNSVDAWPSCMHFSAETLSLVTAEIEKLQQQQIQHENTSKALSGVNGSMWANYMQSIAQTETVQSSNSFKFDKESGFYKDVKAQLYYDPNSTYFFTLDYKKYFVYDSEVQLLCLVDSQGKKVPGGETRPLPSQVAKSGRPEKPTERERPRSRSLRRRRSRSLDARDGRRDRRRENEGQSVFNCSNEAKEREGRFEERGESRASAGSDVRVEEVRHQPIHFPGGDPLAKLANPLPPETARANQPKKKKKAPEGVLGLAASAPLQRPGPVTVFASRPGPVSLQASPSSLPNASAVPPVPVSNPTTSPVAALDWICEVCMRKFSSEETLRKHEQLSELHKQNLMKLGI